jgi:hypothetical protein
MRAAVFVVSVCLFVGGCAAVGHEDDDTGESVSNLAEGSFVVKKGTALALYTAMEDVVISPNGRFFPLVKKNGVTTITATKVTCTDAMSGSTHRIKCEFHARGRTETARFIGQSFDKLQFYAVAFMRAFHGIGELGASGPDRSYAVGDISCSLERGKAECRFTDLTKKPVADAGAAGQPDAAPPVEDADDTRSPDGGLDVDSEAPAREDDGVDGVESADCGRFDEVAELSPRSGENAGPADRAVELRVEGRLEGRDLRR